MVTRLQLQRDDRILARSHYNDSVHRLWSRTVGVKLVVAVTDNDWFKILQRESGLDEVNFWSPSPKKFLSLTQGELLLFKLRAPNNAIAGCGIFVDWYALPWKLAWKAFGVANGTGSAEELSKRVAKYRRVPQEALGNFEIGCRVLTQPSFFVEEDWIPVPDSWSPRIVDYKTYNTEDAEGLGLWHAVIERMQRTVAIAQGLPDRRFGEPQLIHPRLGQRAFRVVVTESYERQCAVTGEKTLPVLEAAHIRPYSDGGLHEARNGLLLRSDIHQLFDDGYVTVSPELRFEVSPRIREEFENGKNYYALHGKRIFVPASFEARPDPIALAWHNQERYQ